MKLSIAFVFLVFSIQCLGQKLLNNEEAYYQFATDIVIYSYNFLDEKVDSTFRFRGKYGQGFFRIGDLREDKNGIGKYYVIKSSRIDRAYSTKSNIDTINSINLGSTSQAFLIAYDAP